MVFARIFYPMSALNMNLLNAVGRSDLFLKVDLSKLPLTVLAMIITIPLGVKAMIIGHVITSALSFLINAYLPGKFYGYGSINQLKDMVPIFIATIGMTISIIILNYFINNLVLQLLIGSLTGSITYLFLCWVFRLEELREVQELFLKLIKKIKLVTKSQS
jgi:riboflavin transporter FmnP